MSRPLLERMRDAIASQRMSALEVAMAEWVLRHGGSAPVAVAMAAATRAVADGHSCVPLDALERGIPGESPICDSEAFRQALDDSPLVGGPDEVRPLIVDQARLYLHRYWQHETRLAERLRSLLNAPPATVDCAPLLGAGGVFDSSALPPGSSHWQAVAAGVALRHRFSVISGGPGTGKTYTVLRLMRLLLEAATRASRPPPLIRLAAPTGKAAARMMTSIQQGLRELPAAEALRSQLPAEALTLHRLLGLGGASTRPRHHADHPLPGDVFIVDEASMIDLPMMNRLLDALPDSARLILLGDRYQLASVESGSVLAELCDAAGENRHSASQQQALAPLLDNESPAADAPDLADHVVTLQISRRFDKHSEIGRLAAAVNTGDADAALTQLADGGAQVDWWSTVNAQALTQLVDSAAEQYSKIWACEDARQALATLGHWSLLCALRVGPYGSRAMNQAITEALARRQQFDPRRRWYHGRAILVLQNDYRAGLFNGDTGVCLRDADGQLRVWFETESGLRALLPTALPEHDSAWAMTVHKSQGSEFDHVSLLLPTDDNPVLSRELLYTGMTRARSSLSLFASEPLLRGAIQRRTQRHSALAERLIAKTMD